jgi:hypothetical protein
VKHLARLFTIALLTLATRGAVAQQSLMPLYEGAGDLPPQMEFADDLPSGEEMGGDALGGQSPSGQPSGGSLDETIEPIAQPDPGATVENFGAYGVDPMYMAGCSPSLFESSGTWLRRGYWYAEGDFMLMNRSWDKKGLLFAFEGGQSTAPGITPGLGTPGFGTVLTLNTITIDSDKPGADGMGRFTLGRFLFRDDMNRDHNAQITYYGSGNWKQRASLTSSTANGLNVNDFIDRVNPSFDGSERIAFEYETGLDTVESNYVVKTRMGRDQMRLQPDGEWIRAANTSQTYSFLTGIRYLKLNEALNITADFDPDNDNSEGGFYHVDTDNNLFGGQLGVAVAHETARWSIGVSAKGGPYWNRMNLVSNFRAGPELVPSRGEVDTTEDSMSFVGECEVLGKWHLRPNLSLRAGMQILYVSSVALAPHQVNFIPEGYDPIADAGDVFCVGSSFGIEAYR